ncbi:MAG: TRAP transporter substrate-binding protein [Clostridiales bacterium]|nr:TRAP transporter substrate-binding protein [Clostridiales bacterium]
MKKLLVLVMAFALVLGATAAMADAVTLTYAEVNPLEGTIVGELAKAFKTKVEELSNGEITIDIQASGVLGSEDQILDNLLGGGNVTDISRISAFALSQYGCTKATLLSLPYVFENRDHFWAFATSDLAKEFLEEPQAVGLPLRGLCYGEEGFRHFFFKDAVTGIEDLKGKKIRVSSDPVMTGMVTGLGASATTVPFTELYSALQTGVVDGAEQPTANYRSNAFQEVAPNFMMDGHTLGAVQLIITDNAWNKLSADQQGWVSEAAAYASQVCREVSESKEAEVLEQLKAEGINVIEVPDKTAWVEAVKDTVSANINGEDAAYEAILAMK